MVRLDPASRLERATDIEVCARYRQCIDGEEFAPPKPGVQGRPPGSVPFGNAVGNDISHNGELAPYVHVARIIGCNREHLAIGSAYAPQTHPIRVAEHRINPHRVRSRSILHNHRQTALAPHFHACIQFLPPGVDHAQAVVCQLATRAIRHQPSPIDRRLDSSPVDTQFHAQQAGTPRPLLDNKILPHTLDAHRVFLGQTRTDETRRRTRHLDTSDCWEHAAGCLQFIARTSAVQTHAAHASHFSRDNTQPPLPKLSGKRTEPEALARRLTLDALKPAVQPRPLDGGLNRRAVPPILPFSHHPDLLRRYRGGSGRCMPLEHLRKTPGHQGGQRQLQPSIQEPASA